jgi:hypothetical protein
MYAGQQASTPTVNTKLYFVDCDQPSRTMTPDGGSSYGWDESSVVTGYVWSRCNNQITDAPTGTSPGGLTNAQIQVGALEVVTGDPLPALSTLSSLSDGSWCQGSSDISNIDACYDEYHVGNIIRLAKTDFPNLQLLYVYTRAYGGWALTTLAPEPNAYEYGFSVQHLMLAQIAQADNSGSADPIAGSLAYSVAPVLLFAPYQWASGATPNSEGIQWPDSSMYFQSLDYIHYAGPDGYPQVGAGTAGGTGGFYGMFNYFLGLSTSGIRDFNFTTWFRPAVATPTATATATATPTITATPNGSSTPTCSGGQFSYGGLRSWGDGSN